MLVALASLSWTSALFNNDTVETQALNHSITLLEFVRGSGLPMTGRSISLIATVVAVAACHPPPPESGFRLAELVSVSTQGVSTDLLLPPFQGSLDLFGQGWENRSAEDAQAAGLWVEGESAEFRFYAAIDGPLTLEAEALGAGTADRPQSVRVLLNGVPVGSEPMGQSWAAGLSTSGSCRRARSRSGGTLSPCRSPRPSSRPRSDPRAPTPARSRRGLGGCGSGLPSAGGFGQTDQPSPRSHHRSNHTTRRSRSACQPTVTWTCTLRPTRTRR